MATGRGDFYLGRNVPANIHPDISTRQGAASLADLLERAGFHIRGRRADCIHCEGRSRLTVSFNDEVAYCHRCQWTGNVCTLSRELGMAVAPETLQQRKRRERVAAFREWNNTCYLILARRARYLTRCALVAKEILAEFPESADCWQILADFYHNEAELFGAFDFLACEKVSQWLELPVRKEKLFTAFDMAVELEEFHGA